MTNSDASHLSQRSLEDIDGIEGVLQTLGKWLQKANFEPGKKDKTQNCADPGLPTQASPLLDALGFKKMDSGRKRYNVLRIHGPTTVRVGLSDIIAIQVWGFDPTLDGQELNTKTVTHITKVAEVRVADGSILDLLIIADRE